MDGNVSGEDISDVDWTADDKSEINVGSEEASTSTSGPCTKLIGYFVAMGFPEKLVSKAIEEKGEGDSDEILNSLLTFMTIEDSPPQQLSTNSDPCFSDCNDVFPNDLSDMDSWSEDDIETLEDSSPQQLCTNSDPCSSDCNDVFPNYLSDMYSWSEDDT